MQKSQAQQRAIFGPEYKDNGLIFCQADGHRLHAANIVRRDFHPTIARARLPRIRFHDLRHCCATLLLRQGTHPKVVQERLGHSTIGVAMDVYSHVLPGMQKEAAKGLATRLMRETVDGR